MISLEVPTKIQLRVRLATCVAVMTTLFLLCVKNAKAFTEQVPASLQLFSMLTDPRAAMLASNVSSWTRRVTSTCKDRVAQGCIPGRVFPTVVAFKREKPSSSSITSLSMAWSMDSVSASLRPFGSWYHEVDPTSSTPVYDDHFAEDYSFTSVNHEWGLDYSEQRATMHGTEGQEKKTNSIRPLKAVRRAASWAVNRLSARPIRSI